MGRFVVVVSALTAVAAVIGIASLVGSDETTEPRSTRGKIWAALEADGALLPDRALALVKGGDLGRYAWRSNWLRLDSNHFIDHKTRHLREINRDGSGNHRAVQFRSPVDYVFLLGAKAERTVKSKKQLLDLQAWLVVATPSHIWILNVMTGHSRRIARRA